jgi:hypothetical protein
MATEDTILAVLSGRKQFDGRQWRVYDSGGTELTDSGGVLWKGVHGALLWNAVLQAGSVPAGRVGWTKADSGRAMRIRHQNQALIAALTAMAASGALQ